MKVFVAVILGIFFSQANAISPEATCAITQSDTFIADPLNCAGYYYCVDGQVASQGTCPSGYVYNNLKGICDYPSNVNCNFGSNACANQPAKTYLPNPINCASYMYCDGKGGATYNTCPNGQIFDPTSISCVWGTTCGTNDCELVQNNKFVNGPVTTENGIKYYSSVTCYNGKPSNTFTCPKGYIFNFLEGECQYNTNAVVGPNCDTTSTNGPVEVNGVYFAADPMNCNSYWLCSSTSGGTPTQLYCPAGFHFQASDATCRYSWQVKPAGANAGCDRCGGYPAGTFVNVLGQGCLKYNYCIGNNQKDTNVTPGTCPTNYEYFNEQSQSCVSTIPNEVCNPGWTQSNT